MSHIFISYSRRDLDFAQKIVDALADNKLDTWIDWKSIPKGEDWEQEIYRGIEEADAFLFLISPDSVTSQMCNKEIAHAVKNGKRILPIFIANVDDRGIYGVTEKFLHKEQREEICRRNFLKCRDGWDDFNKAIEEIRTTIHTDYEWLQYHTELQAKALKWEQKRDNSRLLRGRELREAEQRLVIVGIAKDPQPTDLQRIYLFTSQRSEERQRRQITIGLLTGLAIMVVLSLVAWGQRNEAISQRATAQANEAEAQRQTRIANSQRLTAYSQVNKSSNYDLANLLAVEASLIDSNQDTYNNLINIFAEKSYIAGYFDFLTPSVLTWRMVQDNSLIEIVCQDGYVYLWDPIKRERRQEPIELWKYAEGHGAGTFVAITPDLRTIVSQDSNVIYFWDVEMGRQNENIIDITQGDISEILISPNGKLLAVLVTDEEISGIRPEKVLFYDLEKYQPTGVTLNPNRIGGNGVKMVFSPSGTYLATYGGEVDAAFIWDVNTGELHNTLGSDIEDVKITDIIFNSDETIIATFRHPLDKVELWDGMGWLLDDNKQFALIYSPLISEMVFGPVNTSLVAISIENKILVLNIKESTMEDPAIEYEAIVPDHHLVGFLNDGQTLLVTSNGRFLLINNNVRRNFESLPLKDLQDMACNIAFRNLTQAEWQQYFSGEEYRITCPQWPAGE